MDTKIDTRQVQREAEMAERGRARAAKMVERSLAREVAESPAGLELARRAVAPLTEALRTFLTEAYSGRPGRKHAAARLLKGVDPELAAYITVRSVLNAAVQRYTLKSTAYSASGTLELELIADRFERDNSALYRSVVRTARARGLAPARQAQAVARANREFKVVDKPWTNDERILVGTKLVELAIESMGIVRAKLVRAGRARKTYRIEFTPEVAEWFEQYNDAATLARPLYLPTVVPPKPWEGLYGGAYYSPILRGGAIVTKPHAGQIDALKEAQMGTVYAALNSIQETPWRINRRVFDVMREAWDGGLPLPCLPRREDEPLPEAPLEVVNDAVGGPHRKAWRRVLRGVHERNAASRSTRFEFARSLAIAADNLAHPAIYFPHRIDFRGRAYAASTSLNPQGPDEVRALLEFAEGKPLGDRGVFWLGVHGANLFGEDKVSLEDRYAWARKNAGRCHSVAVDPLGDLWWTEADKPWSFLAWCFEWSDVWAQHQTPSEFVSHLPIALDGSCNGLQHYSAMLRDPVGGAAVNLVPADVPQDIYGEVARVVRMKLSDLMVTEGPDQWIYDAWFQFEVDRKITKRPVMVLPYGGTYQSCREYVRQAVQERFASGQANLFGADFDHAVRLLARLVWDAIGEVVVAAREAMGWLQKVARVATKAGQPLRWTTPAGFVVVQSYRNRSNSRIETRFCGSIVRFRSITDGPTLDAHKQALAVAPNFVHSLDAAALMHTVCAARASGIRAFAMIHDSYGTHAADTEALSTILREEFVRIYQDHDVLRIFYDEIRDRLPPNLRDELPEPPAAGPLDLNVILFSPYFFS